MKPEHVEFLRRSGAEWRSGACTIVSVLVLGVALLFSALLMSGVVLIPLALIGAALGRPGLVDEVAVWVWLATLGVMAPCIIGSHFKGLCADPWQGTERKSGEQ